MGARGPNRRRRTAAHPALGGTPWQEAAPAVTGVTVIDRPHVPGVDDVVPFEPTTAEGAGGPRR